jgi:AcrR family transcriptional regulator
MENNQLKESRRIRYTKMVLRESLMELMKIKPISTISIKEICANADISRSSFYNYYTDQYDLLRKTEEETLDFINANLNKYALYKNDKLGALRMVEEILQYVLDNNKSIYVLFSENGDINFQKNLFSSIYEKNILKSLTDKLPDEQTKQYYFLFIVTGTVSLIYHWIKNGMDKPIPELAKLIIGITSQIK